MLRDEQGSALLLTIVVLVVLLFLGGSLGLLATVETRMVHNDQLTMQTYYLARSGADAMAQYICENPTRMDDPFWETGPVSEPVSLGEGKFIVKVTLEDDSIQIQSTGVVGEQQSVVELTLLAELLFPPFRPGIVGLNTITISGNPTITGDMVTNASAEESVILKGNINIDGDVFVGSDAEDPEKVVKNTGNREINVVNLPTKAIYPDIVFPDLPILPEFGTKTDNTTIASDGYYDSIETSDTLRIDLGGQTRTIGVGTLDLGKGLELVNVNENGRLLLFVEDRIDGLKGNSHINWTGGGKNDPRTLTLYYSGNDTLSISGNWKLVGNMVVSAANVDISGNIDLEGNIFSGGSQVDISGNIEQSLVYVPNGKVRLPGNSKIGGVIADTLDISGNSDIGFTEGTDFVRTFPEEVFGVTIGEGSGGGIGYRRGTWSARR